MKSKVSTPHTPGRKFLFLSFALTLGLLGVLGIAAGDVDRVAQVLFQIVSDARQGNREVRAHDLEEDDLNAFLEEQLALQAPDGLEKISVRLQAENTLITWLTVDMDQIDLGESSLTAVLMRSLFSGEQTLEVEGQLEARNGQGEYTAQRAKLNGMPVPLALLNTLLKTLGDRVEPPFDATRPFPLPYGIDSIQIKARQATLKTGNGEARP